jgi:anti-sigma B factor antagonist
VQFIVTSWHEEGRTVVSATGEIDLYKAPALQERMYELIDAGHAHLVVDLGSVEFLDSSGLGVLVATLKRVRAREGSLRLVCDQQSLLNLFSITGLIDIFEILPTLDQALVATT